MRRLSIVWIPPDPPPTMTTFSFVCSLTVRDFGTTRPTLLLTSFSLALTKILPSRSEAANDQSESSPGASSMSPVQTLKHAPCQGQTTRPSCDSTPSAHQLNRTTVYDPETERTLERGTVLPSARASDGRERTRKNSKITHVRAESRGSVLPLVFRDVRWSSPTNDLTLDLAQEDFPAESLDGFAAVSG